MSTNTNNDIREIRCVETGEVFPGVYALSKEKHFSAGALWKAIEEGWAYKGLHYEYTGNIIPRLNKKKRVKCLETGVVYESMLSAAQNNGFSVSSLSRHLKGLLPSVSNLHFEIVSEKN